MKKTLAILLALVIAFSFAGCSSAPTNGFYKNESMDYSYASGETAESDSFMDYSYSDGEGSAEIKENTSASGRKLIRSVSLSMETLEFESFVAVLQQKVAEAGGYIESSAVNGNSYNYSRSRSASFTCRIPSAKLDAFLSAVDGIGNVTYSYEDQKDVTLNYVDTEARIASLQTEYDRLLELLAQAESVDTIIMLEQRLSDVRYQLESYKSQLRTYDNLVDYSTVEISVDEVQRVSSPEEEGVFARIQSGCSDSLYSVGTGLVDFFVWFVANIPYFAVIAVIALIIVLIVMACLKNSPRHKAKVARKKAEKERRKAERLAKKNGVLPTEAPVPEKPENSENKGE